MMTREMMEKALEGLGMDVSYEVTEEGFEVRFEDFEGFDEDWSEIIRPYDDPEAVDRFEEMIETESLFCAEEDWLPVYHFDGFAVQISYASADI